MKEGEPQAKENNENNNDELYKKLIIEMNLFIENEYKIDNFSAKSIIYSIEELDDHFRNQLMSFFKISPVVSYDGVSSPEAIEANRYRVRKFSQIFEYAKHAIEKDMADGRFGEGGNFIKEFITAAESREIQERMEDVFRIKDEIRNRIVGSRNIRETPFVDIDEIKTELGKIIEDIEKLQQADKKEE